MQTRQGEPDDGQSLIRLMLYTNQLAIEGLIATSNLGYGQAVQPDLIRRVIGAHDSGRSSLLRHDPPVAIINGRDGLEPIVQRVKAGQTVRLDARRSSDPDRQQLRYVWGTYPVTDPAQMHVQDTNAVLTVRIPQEMRGRIVPVLLTVTDEGQPSLRGYRRVLLKVE